MTAFTVDVQDSSIYGVDYDIYTLSLSPSIFLKLDETSGTTLTDSGSLAMDWTTFGSPSLNQSPLTLGSSGSVQFSSGSSQYASVSGSSIQSLITGASGITVAGWFVIPTGVTTEPYFVEAYYDGSRVPFALGLSGDAGNNSYVHWGHYSPNSWKTVSDPNTVVTNTPLFYVGTMDSLGNIKLYLNGSQIATSAVEAPPWSAWAGTEFRIARRWDSASYSTITVDGVAIFNSVLTPAQIQNMYNAGVGIPIGVSDQLVFDLQQTKQDNSGLSDPASALKNNDSEVVKQEAGLGTYGAYDALVDSLAPAIFLKMDETSGTTLTDGGSLAKNWTALGGPDLGQPALISGSGKSIKFSSASSQYASVTDSSIKTLVNGLSGLTVVGWFNMSSTSAPYLVNTYYDSTRVPFALGLGSDGASNTVIWGHYTSSGWRTVSDPTTFPINTTIFYAATADSSGNIQLFKNGTLVASASLLAPAWSSWAGTELRIGRRWDAATYTDMTADGIAIFPSVLTAAQINNLYEAGRIDGLGAGSDRIFISTVVDTNPNVQDDSGASDAFSISLSKSIVDDSGVSDSAAVGGAAVTVSDTSGLSDNYTISGDRTLSISDDANPSDTMATSGILVATLEDLPEVTDSATIVNTSPNTFVGWGIPLR